MFASIIWTILGIIGLIVFLISVASLIVVYKIKHKITSLTKAYDHHPTSPTRREVMPISSKTIDDN